MDNPEKLSEDDWKRRLTPEEYNILRKKGTEPAFTGKYHNTKEKGMYVCRACGEKLFLSETKYDSNSGWPSFFKPIDENSVEEIEDKTLGMKRTEVTCRKCGGHLGHVFSDGPNPTGKRYCINSASLDFKKYK